MDLIKSLNAIIPAINMGHISAKDIYRKLGTKLDSLSVRTPWNDAFEQIIMELYTPEEAALVIAMPYGLGKIENIARSAGMDINSARPILERLCEKGLVMDIKVRDSWRYFISPMVIGIFEYTMMRAPSDFDVKKISGLFSDYMLGDDSFFKANFGAGQKVSPMRSLVYSESLMPDEHAEILDYEKAESLIMDADKYSIGLCSCRHEKSHLGEHNCAASLDTCSSINGAADYMIRHNFSRESSRSEMIENLARSKELGLVITADNIKKDVGFFCHCCSCCCNLLLGYKKYGYENIIVSSSYIASVDKSCTGCGRCAKACPVEAVSMPEHVMDNIKKRKAVVDESVCIGCGVCSFSCTARSILLHKREKRVFHPENTYERIIMQSLERGTLQNLIFDDPSRLTHSFLRGMLGAFLKLPGVKRGIMSDMFRSRFLSVIK